MKLKMALEEKTFDIRLMDKHLAEDKLAKNQVDEFLKNLPDDSENLEVINSDEE